MSHPDEELLADLSLGDDGALTLDQVDHVRACDVCSAVLVELREVRSLIATTPEHRSPTRPPVAVWDRVQRQVDLDAMRHHDLPRLVTVPALPPTTSPYADASPDPAPTRRARRARGGEGRGGGRGRRVTTPALWSAAAGILIGLGTGWAVWDRAEDAPPPARTTVASTRLDTLDTDQELGQARVLRSSGTDSLQVDAQGLDAGDGYLEVWLLNQDGKRMVSLGVLRAEGTATFPLTPVLIAQGYDIVDISREGFDEDSAHSGDSLARGTLAG